MSSAGSKHSQDSNSSSQQDNITEWKVSKSKQQCTIGEKYFDVNSADHAQELKSWCRFHWTNTLSKGMKNYNAPTYHDCCFCFSKRGFAKKAGHPQLQSASMLKIPTLKSVNNPERLYEWIRNRMEIHSRIGRKPLFPSINALHWIQPDQEYTEAEIEEEIEYLTKRLDELSVKQKEAQEEIKQLTEDNKKLLASSKSWCIKYQELLCNLEKDKCSYTDGSPQKMLIQQEHNYNILLLQIII